MDAWKRRFEHPQGGRQRARAGYIALSALVASALVVNVASVTPTSSADASPATIFVGSRKVFTDTGMRLRAGESVTITSAGHIRFGSGSIARLGPTGIAWGRECTAIARTRPHTKPFPAPGLACWSLIGKIGSGNPFEIGRGKVVRAPRAGELYLGVNDGNVAANSGWWAAHAAVPGGSTPPPTTTPPTTPPSIPGSSPCTGRSMTQGQSDINNAPGGTTFCLSGTHNWTLSPKSGDALIGPATLNGGNSTSYAIEAGSATNVTLSNLEIENYTLADQQGAIHVPQTNAATGWTLLDLQVHDNGSGNGGAGANLGNGWQVDGGRYYNNRQEGLGGQVGNSVVVNGVQIDHNNFTNDSYTTRNIDCGYEAGGMKWTSNNVTVENSNIHDNACKGLWTDINANGAVIKNNTVTNNWDEGIFIEISSDATITGNTVTGNGFKDTSGSCGHAWLFAGGITLAASDHSTVTGNTVSGNCNGITGVQQHRPDGNPGLLENDTITGNSIAGPGGSTGAATDDNADLGAAHLDFSGNTISNGMSFCNLSC